LFSNSKEAFVPVLLLAQGDTTAKDMLRRAIEARYGLRPPALESLQIDFKGRARAKLGPITTWVPVEATAYFCFPNTMRWDFTMKAVGVQVGSGIEAFDGTTYRTARGGKAATVISNPELISSMQQRLWAIAAVFLTPLGEHFVKLNYSGENILEVTNTQINTSIYLHLRPDHTLDYVKIECINPDNNKLQNFKLCMSEEQSLVNDLMLPTKIMSYWDGDPYFEVEPQQTETNHQISNAIFSLNM
jgi:hypothetical protein